MDVDFAPIEQTERAYLDAIVAAPDDDGPRLVYADWLQRDHGELHGQLITVQCELARLARQPDTPQLDARLERARAVEAELLARPELAWLRGYIQLARRSFGGAMQPTRGFMATTALVSRAQQLQRWHLGLERYAPFVARMRVLEATEAELEQLLHSGALQRFSALELHDEAPGGRRTGGTLERASGPASGTTLGALTKLELSHMHVDVATARQLFSLSLPALEILRFERCGVEWGVIQALVDHPPPKLRALRMRGMTGYYGPEYDGLRRLGLRELHLDGGFMDRELARELRRAIPRCVLRCDQAIMAVG